MTSLLHRLAVPSVEEPRVIQLKAAAGRRAQAHVLERPQAIAINAALAAERPLLIKGEPGVGKSQLSRAAAEALGRTHVVHVVDAHTEPRDLLYTVDVVRRLADAQTRQLEARAGADPLDIRRYVKPGVLWTAFDERGANDQLDVYHRKSDGLDPGILPRESMTSGVVALIDEIDKADSAIPNALLDALGRRSFSAPDGREVAMVGTAPLVIVTSNDERALPDAFLRRCLVLHLAMPSGRDAVRSYLLGRGRAHFPVDDDPSLEPLLSKAAEIIADGRVAVQSQEHPGPGVAEYIDLIDAVWREPDPERLLEDVAEYVVHKHEPRGAGRA
jgi:MoxR-like ATPase